MLQIKYDTHLKLWIASARHNFKWVKVPIFNLAGKGLTLVYASHNNNHFLVVLLVDKFTIILMKCVFEHQDLQMSSFQPVVSFGRETQTPSG